MADRVELPGDLEEHLVLDMFDRQVLGFPEGGKELRSGRRSPYYYDSRGVLSFNAALDQSGKMSRARQQEFRENLIDAYALRLNEAAENARVDHVFGKAQAVTSLGAVATVRAGLSYLSERIEEPGKNHGSTKPIQGDYLAGERIGVTDDVVTEGFSLVIKAGRILRQAGLNPVAATLQFDREDGGAMVLEKHLYEVNAITGLSRAVRFLRDNNKIGPKELEALDIYFEEINSQSTSVETTYTAPQY